MAICHWLNSKSLCLLNFFALGNDQTIRSRDGNNLFGVIFVGFYFVGWFILVKKKFYFYRFALTPVVTLTSIS